MLMRAPGTSVHASDTGMTARQSPRRQASCRLIEQEERGSYQCTREFDALSHAERLDGNELVLERPRRSRSISSSTRHRSRLDGRAFRCDAQAMFSSRHAGERARSEAARQT